MEELVHLKSVFKIILTNCFNLTIKVMTGCRTGEIITKSCSYNDVAMSNDGKSVYAVGSDMMLREIVDSQVRIIVLITQVLQTLNSLMFL